MTSLDVASWELRRHMSALTQALAEWQQLPLVHDIADLEGDPQRLRLLDQILFRFTKMQDTMGQRLVPATLLSLSEPCEDWPMRDRLDRLEKLGMLNSEDWYRWREIRNRLAHEYPEQPEVRLSNIRAAAAAAKEMLDWADHWLRHVDK